MKINKLKLSKRPITNGEKAYKLQNFMDKYGGKKEILWNKLSIRRKVT